MTDRILDGRLEDQRRHGNTGRLEATGQDSKWKRLGTGKGSTSRWPAERRSQSIRSAS